MLIGRPLAAGKINIDELVARHLASSSVKIDFGTAEIPEKLAVTWPRRRA